MIRMTSELTLKSVEEADILHRLQINRAKGRKLMIMMSSRYDLKMIKNCIQDLIKNENSFLINVIDQYKFQNMQNSPLSYQIIHT